ncbi:MAG: hypothetical protein Ta2D_04360 [Rickettsiales bacterium]|nr:MAG: hypothetical protein Ta2D_04360 [Rickettsiales bacterium]
MYNGATYDAQVVKDNLGPHTAGTDPSYQNTSRGVDFAVRYGKNVLSFISQEQAKHNISIDASTGEVKKDNVVKNGVELVDELSLIVDEAYNKGMFGNSEFAVGGNPRGAHGFGHAYRVGRITAELAAKANLSKKDTTIAVVFALFHDICRASDGFDAWDAESAALSMAFLEKQGFTIDELTPIFEQMCHKDQISNKNAPGAKIACLVDIADSIEIFRCNDRVIKLDSIAEKAENTGLSFDDFVNITARWHNVLREYGIIYGQSTTVKVEANDENLRNAYINYGGQLINQTHYAEDPKDNKHLQQLKDEIDPLVRPIFPSVLYVGKITANRIIARSQFTKIFNENLDRETSDIIKALSTAPNDDHTQVYLCAFVVKSIYDNNCQEINDFIRKSANEFQKQEILAIYNDFAKSTQFKLNPLQKNILNNIAAVVNSQFQPQKPQSNPKSPANPKLQQPNSNPPDLSQPNSNSKPPVNPKSKSQQTNPNPPVEPKSQFPQQPKPNLSANPKPSVEPQFSQPNSNSKPPLNPQPKSQQTNSNPPTDPKPQFSQPKSQQPKPNLSANPKPEKKPFNMYMTPSLESEFSERLNPSPPRNATPAEEIILSDDYMRNYISPLMTENDFKTIFNENMARKTSDIVDILLKSGLDLDIENTRPYLCALVVRTILDQNAYYIVEFLAKISNDGRQEIINICDDIEENVPLNLKQINTLRDAAHWAEAVIQTNPGRNYKSSEQPKLRPNPSPYPKLSYKTPTPILKIRVENNVVNQPNNQTSISNLSLDEKIETINKLSYVDKQILNGDNKKVEKRTISSDKTGLRLQLAKQPVKVDISFKAKDGTRLTLKETFTKILEKKENLKEAKEQMEKILSTTLSKMDSGKKEKLIDGFEIDRSDMSNVNRQVANKITKQILKELNLTKHDRNL